MRDASRSAGEVDPDSAPDPDPVHEPDAPTTRRGLLAGGAALTTAALAGCSSLPIVGDEEPRLGFDPKTLPTSLVTSLPARPSVYPGPVPDQLAAHHRQRARTLLEEVPADLSFPNGMITKRLRRNRKDAAQLLREGPDEGETTPLERLDHWSYVRMDIAEVWGAYHAATGDVDATTLASRREEIRHDLVDFERAWDYPGTDVVSALAVNRRFEDLRTSCRRSLTPHRRAPDAPTAAVFRMGSLVRDLERARSELDDLTGLHDAYRNSVSSTLSSYRANLPILAQRLDELVAVSRQQVAPYLADDARPSDFERDVEGLPAEELFVEARRTAGWRIDDAERARNRGNDARAAILSAQALVGIVALSTVVDAIRAGKYGMPDSVAVIERHRDAAVEALDRVSSLDPSLLATVLTSPAWDVIDEQSYTFQQVTEREREHVGELDQSDVVSVDAAFGLALHLARAVPEVLRRVRSEVLTVEN
ncbi:hypothetical protein [Halospeciosus flavus]|uniref:Uncharacterized protein n=2 Tax=Halospeciosus flavus TaxID=3032283 RepID=A0ABD5Z650_9EURY|nr:hypothetical protein [Halospeciosus flavus]